MDSVDVEQATCSMSFELDCEAIERKMAETYATRRRFGEHSNEFLWTVAMLGNKFALAELYTRNLGLWFNRIPFDVSGMMLREDWEQLAMNEFYLKWQRYDKDCGVRFSTWMATVIRNAWCNQIRRQDRVCQEVNYHTIRVDDFSIFEQFMITEFASYSDEVYMKSFITRFRSYLEREVYVHAEADRQSVIRVFDLSILFGAEVEEGGLEKISALLSRHNDWVRAALRLIKKYIIEFGMIEKQRFHGSIVFSR